MVMTTPLNVSSHGAIILMQAWSGGECGVSRSGIPSVELLAR